jgi:predicted lipid-binding transport protein (Tim44 family)
VTDAAAIGPMVATLLHGMAMALFKTLVGSVLNVWLMVDYRLLEGGAVHLLTRAIEEGERNAAP